MPRIAPLRAFAPSFTASVLRAAALLAAAPLLCAAVPAGEAPFHLLARYAVGGSGGWDYLTVDGRTQRLYISRGAHVMVMDTETGKIVGDIPDTQGVHGIALAPLISTGYTSNGGDSTVTVFNTKTLAPEAKVNVGKGPDCIVYDHASHRVFTFNGEGSSATAIEAVNNAIAGTIPLGGQPEYAVPDGDGHVYANLEDKSEIVEIDSNNLKVLNRWSLSPGQSPSGLAMDTRSRRLFSVCRNGMMVVMNANNGHVVATPAIGRGPDAAAFDFRRRLALSSNGDGTLTCVHEDDQDHYTVVANVATEPGARTMALDPRSHRVYTVTAKAQPAPAGQTGRFRRGYEPGSFVVLVYGPQQGG